MLTESGIVFGGSGANRTLTLNPVADGNGSTTVTLWVSDGQSVASTTFTYTVAAVNDAPTGRRRRPRSAAIAEDNDQPAGATISSLSARCSATRATRSSAVRRPTASPASRSSPTRRARHAGPLAVERRQRLGRFPTTVSTASALLLAPATLVRFVPVADYNGAPGALTLRLVDDSAGAVASGSQRQHRQRRRQQPLQRRRRRRGAGHEVTPVNDAPVVTTTAAPLAWTENAGAVAVDAGIVVADIDDSSLVARDGRRSPATTPAGQDQLVFTNQNGIAGSWTPPPAR